MRTPFGRDRAAALRERERRRDLRRHAAFHRFALDRIARDDARDTHVVRRDDDDDLLARAPEIALEQQRHDVHEPVMRRVPSLMVSSVTSTYWPGEYWTAASNSPFGTIARTPGTISTRR
jgi:hypothetical protein